jgi:hypothetical protein
MSIEKGKYSSNNYEIPTPLSDLEKKGRGELSGRRGEGFAEIFSESGIENLEENIELVERQREIRQHPEGYDDILQNINDEKVLKTLMVEKGIRKIVHSEGLTVWDHTKKALEVINKRDDIPEEKKKALRLIIFYHDLGKVDAAKREENIEKTKKNLEKGELNCAMKGHQNAELENIKKGLIANGIKEEELRTYMIVIENHMNTSLLDQDAKKIVKLFESFGDTEDKRKRVVDILSLVFEIDGSATENIKMEDGQLFYSKNDKKIIINADDLWKKYEEGKRIIQEESEKELKKQKEEEFENQIFSGKLTDYLITERKISKGKEFGEAIRMIKKTIEENRNLSPEKLKDIINRLEL